MPCALCLWLLENLFKLHPGIVSSLRFTSIAAAILIGISLLMARTFLAAFLRAVRVGQYEDDYLPRCGCCLTTK